MPEWLKVLAGCFALMLGASAPPLAIEYYRPTPPQHVAQASEKPPESANLQHNDLTDRGTEKIPLIVKVVPSEPAPQAEAREKQKDENERRLADYTKWLFFATVFLGAATFGLAVVAFFQMRDARESIAASVRLADAAVQHASHAEQAIQVSKQSAQRQLRAYVTLAGIEKIPVLEQGTGRVLAWRYAPIWQNTGFTPTRRARNHVNWDFFSRSDSPADRGFADLGPTSGLDDKSELVIGPRTTVTGQAHVIGIDWIFAAIALEGRIFLWGWYEYDDAFADETPRRRTEFCSYLSWPGLPDMANPAHAATNTFSAFNGTDEDCYRQPIPRQKTT